MKVEFSVDTGIVGSRKWEIVEVPNNSTEEEIEALFVEWAWEQLNAFWRPVK